MKKIVIEHTKNIGHLELRIPERAGVYLLVGANGAGKTTVLVCLDRICNSNGFARGFSTSRSFGEVDQYENAAIKYEMDNPNTTLLYRKKSRRWAVSPKGGSRFLSNFGFAQSIFIRADSKRIDASDDEIQQGRFVAAPQSLKRTLNTLFETTRFNRLMKLRVGRGRGRNTCDFYVIKESENRYYSEKRFSTGELAILRLIERLDSVSNNSLVLLDEAEMALHPRIQKNLLEYLKRISIEKNLTVFISTHSITMIKATDKAHIMSLEECENGHYKIINPCYPAKAIGNVDFMDNIIYDAVFFVEDEMAHLLLKKMIRKCCEHDHRFSTVTNCIVPVGGYEQTAMLAINTKQRLLNRSSVFAVWDEDVFTETIPQVQRIADLYNAHRDLIYRLGCTPELWMIDKLEATDHQICQEIRNQFHTEVTSIIHSAEYLACNSPKPRKLAKQKMDVVIAKLSGASGESSDVVLERFADILIENAYTIGQICSLVAPMLQRTN